MPRKPDRPCRHPGCAALSDGAYCPAHRKQYARRESAAARGYDAKWQRERLRFLRTNPLCVRCRAEGRLAPATVVDHIVPHRGN
ncbi:HNH endonuclease, partial [Eubacteriales bacterium OttesenSCG-928-N13]|nr:HNH endonuclease [Eubacteriales bacterium OttesenSCG-928-N13]